MRDLLNYIVCSVLKDGASTASHLEALNSIAARDAESYTEVTNKYTDILHGYAAVLRGAALDHVLASPDVVSVEQNGIVSIKYEETRDADDLLAREPIVARAAGGAGVDIYGIGKHYVHRTFQ